MSHERCFGGFAGHNVDRRLWGIAVLRQEPLGRQGCAASGRSAISGKSVGFGPESCRSTPKEAPRQEREDTVRDRVVVAHQKGGSIVPHVHRTMLAGTKPRVQLEFEVWLTNVGVTASRRQAWRLRHGFKVSGSRDTSRHSARTRS